MLHSNVSLFLTYLISISSPLDKWTPFLRAIAFAPGFLALRKKQGIPFIPFTVDDARVDAFLHKAPRLRTVIAGVEPAASPVFFKFRVGVLQGKRLHRFFKLQQTEARRIQHAAPVHEKELGMARRVFSPADFFTHRPGQRVQVKKRVEQR